MKSFKLTPTGDIAFENGDIVWVENADDLAQMVRVELSTYRGEWFLDADMGVDYYGRIYVKNPNMESIRAELLTAILRVPGIVRVDSLTWSLDKATRKLTVNFSASAANGQTIASSEVI